MFIYFEFFFFIVFALFINLKFSKKVLQLFYNIVFFVFVIFIGFRYEVGGDWEAYLYHYNNFYEESFWNWDIGYRFLELVSHKLSLGIYGVNVLCAILFLYGFFKFIKTFNVKLSYALLISFPYLILVVVNGYSRQGVAIGLGMAMISFFYEHKLFKSIFFYILAILFHKSALILTIVYFVNLDIKKIILLNSIILVFFMVLYERFEILINSYLIDAMSSSGGIIRIMVFIFGCFLFFINYKEFKKNNDYKIWKIFSLFSLFVLLFTIYTKATTLGNRILLYFYPLQIVVFYRVLFYIKDINLRFIYFFTILFLFAVIMIVWLNFASHRFSWIPYKNILEFLF